MLHKPNGLIPSEAVPGVDRSGRAPAANGLLELARTGRRQWPILLIVPALGLLLTLFVLSTITPRYSATALLMLDSREQRLAGIDVSLPVAPNLSTIDGEVEVMSSPAIAARVIRELDLAHDPEFAPRPNTLVAWLRMLAPGLLSNKDPQSAAEIEQLVANKLERRVAIQRRGVTPVIAIEAQSENPERAAALANAYAKAYLDEQQTSRSLGIERAEAALASRVADLAEQLKRTESQLSRYALEQAGKLAGTSAGPKLDQIQADIEATTRQRLANLAESQELQKALSQGRLADLVRPKPDSATVDVNRRNFERQLSAVLSSVGDRAAVDKARAIANSRVDELKDQSDRIDAREQELRRQLNDLVLQTDLPTEVSVQLYRNQEELGTLRTLYQGYLSRLKQVSQQRGLVLPDARVVASALVPAKTSYPPTLPLLLVSLPAWIALALGLAWLRDTYARGFSNVAEMERVLGAPCLAEIPLVKRGRSAELVSELVVNEPASAFAESIRKLRVSLDIASGAEDLSTKRTYLITSTRPAEGKSTIAVSLARAEALSGKKTIIIDCDLRRPSIHRLLQIEHPRGLIDLLQADKVEGPVGAKEAKTPLFVIPNGGSREFPSDRLLISPKFRHIIEACKQIFDVVILDAPPLGGAADPLVLTQYVNTVLYLVRAEETNQAEVTAVFREMQRSFDGDVFLVLNGVGYASFYYQYYNSAA
jgi:capsular exopolysaccharide synthesis family protein